MSSSTRGGNRRKEEAEVFLMMGDVAPTCSAKSANALYESANAMRLLDPGTSSGSLKPVALPATAATYKPREETAL